MSKELTIIQTIDGTWFAGTTDSKVFRSKSQGANWEFAELDKRDDIHITTLTEFKNAIYAGTKDDSIFKTVDGLEGLEWSQTAGLIRDKPILSLEVFGDFILAATGDEGVFISENGENWLPRSLGSDSPAGVAELVVNPNFILTRSGQNQLFRSTNGGLSWIQSDDSVFVNMVYHQW